MRLLLDGVDQSHDFGEKRALNRTPRVLTFKYNNTKRSQLSRRNPVTAGKEPQDNDAATSYTVCVVTFSLRQFGRIGFVENASVFIWCAVRFS